MFACHQESETEITSGSMGKEVAAENGASGSSSGEGSAPLETRPGILLVGPSNVGKRTLLSRLLSIDLSDTSDLSSGILCQGWTVDTKYYTADLSIWIAHLDEGFSLGSLPIPKKLDALVMVFDMSDESSLLALKDWVAKSDIKGFEILLCIGNKADLVTGHPAHTEYRRRLQKHGESSSDPHPEYANYGIDETEACSLIGHEEPTLDIRMLCFEWCSQLNIEYIEACASSAEFDKCLSVDGDIQGVDRLYGALSAHMWPGMILKTGKEITNPYLVEKEEFTDDESDYEVEYEVLSHGSDEPWDRASDAGSRKTADLIGDETDEDLKDEMLDAVVSTTVDIQSGNAAVNLPAALSKNLALENGIKDEPDVVSTAVDNQDERHEGEISSEDEQKEVGPNGANASELDDDDHYGLDELERLMYEIGNVRENLRLMPDFQRRERAAMLAMKMAAMFGGSSDEEGL